MEKLRSTWLKQRATNILARLGLMIVFAFSFGVSIIARPRPSGFAESVILAPQSGLVFFGSLVSGAAFIGAFIAFLLEALN